MKYTIATLFAHDICHNRCGRPGWNRAWAPPHSPIIVMPQPLPMPTTAPSTGPLSKFFQPRSEISFNDEIAAKTGSRRGGLRGFFGAGPPRAAMPLANRPPRPAACS